MKAPVICWVRRDIRTTDHHALAQALQSGHPVQIVFVFDESIIAPLREKKSGNSDRRLSFIISALADLNSELHQYHSSLEILYGDPIVEIPRYAQKIKAKAVYCCEDYEPYSKRRDSAVESELRQKNIDFFSFKDHVIFGPREVLKEDHSIYKVFSAYKRKWFELFLAQGQILPSYTCKLKNLIQREKNDLNQIDIHDNLGFKPVSTPFRGTRKDALMRLNYFAQNILANYHKSRDYPAQDGTSMLSCYLRHGLVSIRELFQLVAERKDEGAQCWMSELIWREFYQMLLANRAELASHAFRPEYDKIKWRGDRELFNKWASGQTGFPIVDAAMRCLAETGLMPNRLRMVCASFLCKTLLVDWRWGEEHFAKHLFDFDLAANNGGWQWCASCGVDALPYFRIFNPFTQREKFDPESEFIKRWCPELAGPRNGNEYPAPIVDYKLKRDEALHMYKEALHPSK